MAENIIINNTTPNNQSSNSSGWSGLIRSIIILVVIISILALIFGVVLFVDNYEAIATVFTTGFIGWLNPFDDPDGDTGPIDAVLGKGATTGIGFLFPNPIRRIFGFLK